jgi:hypothetical protein
MWVLFCGANALETAPNLTPYVVCRMPYAVCTVCRMHSVCIMHSWFVHSRMSYVVWGSVSLVSVVSGVSD